MRKAVTYEWDYDEELDGIVQFHIEQDPDTPEDEIWQRGNDGHYFDDMAERWSGFKERLWGALEKVGGDDGWKAEGYRGEWMFSASSVEEWLDKVAGDNKGFLSITVYPNRVEYHGRGVYSGVTVKPTLEQWYQKEAAELCWKINDRIREVKEEEERLQRLLEKSVARFHRRTEKVYEGECNNIDIP